ncbi:MAG: glycosyltransferase [Candidatus Omnitrophota bacterium]|jgi:glycosyltransferase involved in cell wall biosynthesis
MNLSVIIPAHNEEKNLLDVITGIESSLEIPHELIVVNDHSADRTAELAEVLSKKYPAIKLVNNPGRKGFADAIKFGLRQAHNELIVFIMADSCDDAQSINAMIKKIGEGYDVVCGSRYIKGGARIGGSKIKGFFSYFMGISMFHLAGIPTHDIANTFKMYRKGVLDSIDMKAASFEIAMELPLRAHYAGFKVTEVPTVWKERNKGKSNFNMLMLFPKYLRFYLWSIAKKFWLNIKRGEKWLKF